ncbi:hypothetical protein TRFO_41971 [Tritrichomonas foetus]|uniref:Uncharacterized protein n=1 Tax=Tritrichomonas foetus TaxID=1144522 RepID=A0A1J4L2Q2_9EUKA|nr:hypothetical protein TRFO_41971 [Tritrichomonas foetus]|eukprot:OHT16230.1 hypothetical protein TRFO_41971 [Tritrichomonas foetus]
MSQKVISVLDLEDDVKNGIEISTSDAQFIQNLPNLPSECTDSEILDWLRRVKTNSQASKKLTDSEIPQILHDLENMEKDLDSIFS